MTHCWIITDGKIGTENQCLGVAEALGITPEIKRIDLRSPWRQLSPYLRLEQSWSFTGDSLAPPYPDLILASGRKSIAAARYLKKASQDKSFTVQIQDPRIGYHDFDLVAVPQHDPARGENVFVMQAAPNRITEQALAPGLKAFSPAFKDLPPPRVAVLIGGKSKSHHISAGNIALLSKQLKALARDGYSLMITTSRRTEKNDEAALRAALDDSGPHIYFWDGKGETPYYGMLGWADFIMVTADSVSMVSEAATTGKPVYIIPVKGGSPRLNKFYHSLFAQDIIRPFTGTLAHYRYTPLNDAATLAAEIKKRLAERGAAR